jgi:glutamyl-Q tRNA(Asp) synthetase
MMHSPVTTRFAPSPTGYLHLGHAYSAMLNARRGERFILRIEDIDRSRCRQEFAAALLEDLAWLGLRWEEPVLYQSQQMHRYEQALEQLRERGLLYRCFRTRKDIEESLSAPHVMPGAVFTNGALPKAEERRALDEGRPFAWRLSMGAVAAKLGERFTHLTYREAVSHAVVQKPANAQQFGDVVLGRKDSGTSYHLACVLDDAMQGITHVIRGEELREAAGLHVLLYLLLGLEPPVYEHHAMLLNAEGRRLSKRDGALSLRHMRAGGASPDDVLREMRRYVGPHDPLFGDSESAS